MLIFHQEESQSQLFCIGLFPQYEMKVMRIIADNTVPYLKGIAEPFAEVHYLDSNQFTPSAVRKADALIIRSIDKCTRALLEGSQVKLITTATIGFDHIDTDYCREAGIQWKNAPGCNAVSVAQYVLASLVTLSLRRKEQLEGKIIGIVGVGHVGREVEKLCSAYGMHILRNDPPRAEAEGSEGFVSLEAIACEADIITFHTPLTREGRFATQHLADKAFFHSLQKKPWFINASRGAVHDTEALLEAHRSGQVSELILDCWENEPNIDCELVKRAAIATPHIAGFSADGKANGTRMCLENIANFFHVTVEKLLEVVPPAPSQPTIDLSRFAANHRIEQAILSSFNPQLIDGMLRKSPERFEWFRAHYDHPREYQAYTIERATLREETLLRAIGFR